MRRLMTGAIAGALAAAGAAGAIASTTAPSIHVKATVTPNKAGTARHPQGVVLNTQITWQFLGSSQPIVKSIDLMFPKGSLYNGGRYPSCSLARLTAAGPAGCPKASIMGSGTAKAYAGTIVVQPRITVVNGGPNRVYFFTAVTSPVQVQSPVVGKITRLAGKYTYRLHVTIPKMLQSVAGIAVKLTFLSIKAGRKSWLATTGCGPGGRWPFSVTSYYTTGGKATDTLSVRCRS